MEVNKTDVKKLIEISTKDTFFNHFVNIITLDFSSSGEIKENEIMVWKQNLWNMTIYPIFIFKFNSRNHLIDISSKINPVGKLFNVGILLGIISSIILLSINDFDVLKNWKIISLFISIIFLGIYLAYKVYSFERQNQLDKIFEILDIEEEKNNTVKESSINKVITRILLYPFCIGLIILTIFHLFPIGEIMLGMGSLAIGGTFLCADLKIILERKTTGNNGYRK